MLKESVAHVENGTGTLPYEPNKIGYGGGTSNQTEDEQRAELERKAKLFSALPSEPTWKDMSEVYAKLYPESVDELLYEAETGRGYRDTQYNPKSKWDWYQVGGRWTGYFRVKRGADRTQITNGSPGVMTERNTDVMRCDAGRKSELDLVGMRDQKGEEAGGRYDRFHKLVGDLPEANSWRVYLHQVDNSVCTIEQARAAYHAQPRILAIKGTEFDQLFGGDVVTEYAVPRAVCVERARARAVPGYATLTHEGKWMSPGDMGWFGMSSDDESSMIGYLEVANAYLDSLPDDVYLLCVDCHI
jgi:hypothetical protein